jgi:hypothetical protein
MSEIGFYEHPDQPGKVLRIITCDCGQSFEVIDWFEEQCPVCGQLYNGAGQKLAPRDQWGEETGETLADIYSPIDPEEVGGLYE